MVRTASAVILTTFAITSVGHGQSQSQMLAFANVNVVDVEAGIVRPNMLVVLERDRISRVELYREGAAPEGATVITADDKYLIPGLWDMHVHAYDEGDLSLFIANGVTGVRQMWGMKMHHEWVPRITAGGLVGPRQVIGSPIVDGPQPVWSGSVPVADAQQARAVVERMRRDGAAFVKVYSLLPRDAYFAIADQSRTLRIPFAGHVPFGVSVIEAAEAGHASVEHMSDVMFSASSREEEFRRELNDAARTDLSDAGLRPIRRRQAAAVFESYDAAKAERVFETLVKNGTAIVPTLVVERSTASLDDENFRNDPHLKYTLRRQRLRWDPSRDFRFIERTAEDWAQQKRAFKKRVEVVGDMHRLGVRVLAGTDMGNPFCFPGFSLHDELGLLVEAGLTPVEALRTATINPARYLGRWSSAGTVEVGKSADAVLLDANPLTDIRNTTKIAAVIAAGRYFDRGALDSMLQNAEARANRLSIGETLGAIVRERGIRAALAEYERLNKAEPTKYDFAEEELNTLGYQLLGEKRVDEAVEIFKLNVQVYPAAANTYDSLAEAYMVSGLRELAIQNYERSLQLEPANSNAVAQLRKLREAR